MKKFILPILILFMCAGCTDIKYGLNINDEILSESVNVYDESYVHYNEKDDIHIGDISAFEFFFQSLPYDATGDQLGNYRATRDYKTIDEYLNNSFVFSKFIDINDVVVNGSKIKIGINVDDNIVKTLSDTKIKSLSISLYIPYYVSSHNADSVNNNTYNWKFDDIENASLKINFDMSKSYKYGKTLLTIVVVSVFCVIIVGVIVYFIIKRQKVNEI